jgi:hypothetical protein
MVDITNPLSMSDDDIMKMDGPPSAEASEVVETPAATETTPAVVEQVPEPKTEEAAPNAEPAKVEEAPAADSKADGEKDPEGSPTPKTTEEKPVEKAPEGEKPKGDVPATGSETKEPEAKPIDYKASYDALMAPIKANGKTIDLKDVEEVRQLVQQGANYTRKMQAIAPHRKMLTMLENNGLLSEDKLSFLIDLEKGDPKAVQKLLKEKGIDTMSIDTDSEPTYLPGNHRVNDLEVAFNTNLEELSSTEEGVATLTEINTKWDDASKAKLGDEPSLMTVIHTQRENGIYAKITDEMDRRRVLGKIAPETSFIDAYKAVGDDLNKSGGFADLAPKPKTETEAPAKADKEPVGTSTAKPKSVVENGDKANAASPTQSTQKPAKAFVNPLAMSDEEFNSQFMKMTGRV